MNKKAKLYLLILVNLAAWGYVGYKVYGALQGDDTDDFSYDTQGIKKIDIVIEKDSSTLRLNYPDPFLKNFSSPEKPVQRTSSNTPVSKLTVPQKNVSPKVETPVPVKTTEIKYLGLVKNNSSGNTTALLTVNGRSVFTKAGDNVDGYLVSEIRPESIKLSKGKNILIITK